MSAATLTRDGPAQHDYVIDQDWDRYTAADHAIWQTLFRRQSRLLPGRACREFLDGINALGVAAEGIPEFERLSEVLYRATGWRLVAVPGLVPDEVFFDHLAERRFPATNWIRRADQMDYLQEPDVFHDVFGHVPLLVHPVFADYLQAYGRAGRKAMRLSALPYLARLYWYTVEFGLIRTAEGLRIYGSGILSSRRESSYCLESPAPLRLAFDLHRITRTRYRIDDLQPLYFVIESFHQLFEATAPDFAPFYRALRTEPEIPPGLVEAGDRTVLR
ncbi:MAG: phenylalanine 4-monooxygenase [Alphaproteobacteria bacterium]|nr:phenylalanine 4-monooxygenase [Alphaproteobacteria bacterium]